MTTLDPDTTAKLTDNPDQTRRDRWGRYLVLPPGQKKPVGYTRATTIAKALDDTSSLMAWNSRMTAIGLASRPDLIALVASTPQDDKKTLDGIVKRASEAGGATVRRDLGTAIHGMLEQRLNDPSYLAPEPYQGDIDAIIQAVTDAGMTFVPGMAERIVVNDDLQIAGTFDLLLTDGTDTFIADLKTGSSVKYGGLGFAIQLAIYANAHSLYTQGLAKDGSEDRRDPMPQVSKTLGIIVHCEPGTADVTMHWLDLAAGTEALHTALEVRKLRKTNPLSKFTPAQALAAFNGKTRPGQIQHVDDEWRKATAERISQIIVAGHVQDLLDAWPENHPTLKSGDPITLDQADGISRTLDVIERQHRLPFSSLPDQNPPPKPPAGSKRRRAIDDTKATLISLDDVDTLNQHAVKHLTEEGFAWVQQILEDAHKIGRSLSLTPPRGLPARRRYQICQLLIQIGNHADNDLAWAVLDLASDHTIPHHSLGDAFGTLRQNEAQTGLRIANAIDNLQLTPMWDENGCRLEGDVKAVIDGTPTDKETQE